MTPFVLEMNKKYFFYFLSDKNGWMICTNDVNRVKLDYLDGFKGHF